MITGEGGGISSISSAYLVDELLEREDSIGSEIGTAGGETDEEAAGNKR